MARRTKMNSITSPELLAQVNPENTQLLNEFLDYLRSLQRSETTIRAYEETASNLRTHLVIVCSQD